MKYPDGMDKECVALCDAINALEGLRTIESCCGHDKEPFRIYFKAKHLKELPILLFYTDPYYMGFRWTIKFQDGGLSPVILVLQSEAIGPEAEAQAQTIADGITTHLNLNRR